MPRPDEGMIHAWLDGELSAEEAEQVAKLVAEDAEWGAAVAEARGLIAASSRIVSALDVIPAGVMPAGSRAAPARRSRFTVKPWMRMAAGMVLVVGTATAVLTRTANTPAPGELSMRQAAAPPTSADEAAPVVTPLAVAPSAVAAGVESPVPASPAPSAMVDTSARERSADALVAKASAEAAKTLGDASAAGARGLEAVGRVSAAPAAEPRTPPARAEEARVQEPRAEAMQLRRESRADLASVAPVSAAAAGAAGAASDAAAPTLVGCWRAQVTGRADSVLADPRIARQSGDTLVIVVAADGRTALVRREGESVVRGTTRLGAGTPVPFVGTRVACPRTP